MDARVVTLMSVGWTVSEAHTVLTKVVGRLRDDWRSQGFRPEYVSVLKSHANFEEDGFCWYLFFHRMGSLSFQQVSTALWYATRGRSSMVQIQEVRDGNALEAIMMNVFANDAACIEEITESDHYACIEEQPQSSIA
jgi:hypothetical protein